MELLTNPRHHLYSDMIANEIVSSNDKEIVVRIQFDSQRLQHEAFDITFDGKLSYHQFIWFIWLWNVRQNIQKTSIEENMDLNNNPHRFVHLNVWIDGFDNELKETPSCTVFASVLNVKYWLQSFVKWRNYYHHPPEDASRNRCEFHFYAHDKYMHCPVLVCEHMFRYFFKQEKIFLVSNISNL